MTKRQHKINHGENRNRNEYHTLSINDLIYELIFYNEEFDEPKEYDAQLPN